MRASAFLFLFLFSPAPHSWCLGYHRYPLLLYYPFQRPCWFVYVELTEILNLLRKNMQFCLFIRCCMLGDLKQCCRMSRERKKIVTRNCRYGPCLCSAKEYVVLASYGSLLSRVLLVGLKSYNIQAFVSSRKNESFGSPSVL